MAFRITYSVLNANMDELHVEFDAALKTVQSELGRAYPSHIGGKPFESGHFVDDVNPADTRQLLARFHAVPVSEIDRVINVAKAAQNSWGFTPWQERARILRKAADLISERRMRISAIMCLETGKNRLEALGDTEESADLCRYYAGQLEESNGFLKPLASLSPNEKTKDILRPYGVFAVISPFNFPMALATGMSAAALLGGNAAILKPSVDTPWCAEEIFKAFRDAGIPDGVFQVLHGSGTELGRALVSHHKIDGVAFTGSLQVGLDIMRNLSQVHPKPALLELGGKNPAIICESADLNKAVEGCFRSAFGLSGQKCSALSRVFVHSKLKDEFLKRLTERTQKITIGDPLLKETYMGPVINGRAVARYDDAIIKAQKDGKIWVGGRKMRDQDPYRHGHFVDATVVEISDRHELATQELFLPFLTVHSFDSLESAIARANDSLYGLTAGIFSEKKEDVDFFMDHIHAGILYANRQTGATTGAWPGVQSFCGWKGSGSTGKGGCGPYYVSQFMREQSQTRME